MDKMLPLFRSDIFVKENVGTEEQREDLKKQILHAKENDIGTQGRSNHGCWRSDVTYDMEWLYDEMRTLTDHANQIYFEDDPVFKSFIEGCKNSQFDILVKSIMGQNINDQVVGEKWKMINLLGDEIENLKLFNFHKYQKIHVYGKKEIKNGRKMGHITYPI